MDTMTPTMRGRKSDTSDMDREHTPHNSPHSTNLSLQMAEGGNTPSIVKTKNKKDRKSTLEKQLEIDMTPKMVLRECDSPEELTPNKSRYGRTRKLKTNIDFYPTDVALQIRAKLSKTPKKSKTPNTSPVNNLKTPKHNINETSKATSHINVNHVPIEMDNSQNEIIDERNNSGSQLIDDVDLMPTSWKNDIHKKPLKVYVRKDLIQKKQETKKGSDSFINSLFSYPLYNESENISIHNNEDTNARLNSKKPSPKRSLSLKKINKSPITYKSSPLKEKSISDKNTIEISQSNVEYSSPCNKDSIEESKKDSPINVGSASTPVYHGENYMKGSKKINIKRQLMQEDTAILAPETMASCENQTEVESSHAIMMINALEESCNWKDGELLWARVGSYPFWPCLVTRDPFTLLFVKIKKVGRSETYIYHVTFFGDGGRRSWISATSLMKFDGVDHFNKMKEELTLEIKKKDPKYCHAFDIRGSTKTKWELGVNEAEMLKQRPQNLRVDFFIDMFLSSNNKSKGRKEKNCSTSKKNNGDVSLSDSLFDSLIKKLSDEKQTPEKSKSAETGVTVESTKTIDVVNMVDNCLNSLAAKTGNEKIKIQTHMDRWLLKAKNPISLVSLQESPNEIKKCKGLPVDEDDKSFQDINLNNANSSTKNVCNLAKFLETNPPALSISKRRKSVANIKDSKTNNESAVASKASVSLRRKSVVLHNEYNGAPFDNISNVSKTFNVHVNVIKWSTDDHNLVKSPENNKDSVYQSTSKKKITASQKRKSVSSWVQQHNACNNEKDDMHQHSPKKTSILRRRKSVVSQDMLHSNLQHSSEVTQTSSVQESVVDSSTDGCNVVISPENKKESTKMCQSTSNKEITASQTSVQLHNVFNKEDKKDDTPQSDAKKISIRQRRKSVFTPSNNNVPQSTASRMKISPTKPGNGPESIVINNSQSHSRRKSFTTTFADASVLDNNAAEKVINSSETQVENKKKITLCNRRKSFTHCNEFNSYQPNITENVDVVNSFSFSKPDSSRLSTLRKRKTIDNKHTEYYSEGLDQSVDSKISAADSPETKDKKEISNDETTPSKSSMVSSLRRRKSVVLTPKVGKSESTRKSVVLPPEVDKSELTDKSVVFPPKVGNSESVDQTSELQIDTESEKEKKNEKKTKALSKYGDPDFIEFLDLHKDTLVEENAGLTEEDQILYIYQIWQYGESKKTEDMRNADDYCLVKGMTDEPTLPEPKKQRKRNKDTLDEDQGDDKREKPQRKSTIKSYFIKDSDLSDGDIDVEDQIVCHRVEKNGETESTAKVDPKPLKKGKRSLSQQEVVDNKDETKDPLDYYMELLKITKQSIFKGLTKEKVCALCEKPSGLVKCKGACGDMFHLECVKRQLEQPSLADRNKYKKKKGRKSRIGDGDNLDESGLGNDTVIEDYSRVEVDIVKPLLDGNGEVHLSPSKKLRKETERAPLSIVTDAYDFEFQVNKQMKEMLEKGISGDADGYDLDTSSTSLDEGDHEWSGVKAGDCVIVDVVEHKSKNEQNQPPTSVADNPNDSFKCNDCVKNNTPLCFVCKPILCAKNGSEERQRCNVPHCHKFYHIDCLQPAWPQTKFSSTCPTKYQKKTQIADAMSCPRHVCHTCVSDDPRGSGTRFSGDKLARCVRCPATYHCFTRCIPAGTRLLTASQIVCPRHNDSKLSKVLYHVNTSWCFICAKGGMLICCETCPTSFHAECLKISPPTGGYICEECETGRLPLYEELVWVKCGYYRWWPALVLHPSDIPPNIAALSHDSNQFAVRFFGDYNHYWVNSGRVFLYQEGDTGHTSGKKSVDNSFLSAVKQAQQAYDIIKNMKQRDSEEEELVSSLLPPHYVKLKVNRPVGGAAINYKCDKGNAHRCECDPTSENPCAPDSDCINRMLYIECSPSNCPAGDKCCNQAFEKRLYPHLVPNKTKHRGWGLKALTDINKGDFVIEYVGEIIDEAEFQRRMSRKREIRDENYYFLTLDKDRMIDAGPKGNAARFMNHSCEPNCETQKWKVNGDTRVGLFALQDIPAGFEVTFNYNLLCADDDKKKCMCGAQKCAGFIGAKVKQDETVARNPKQPKVKRKYTKKSKNLPKSDLPKSVKIKGKNYKCKVKVTETLPAVPESEAEKDLREISEAISLVYEEDSLNPPQSNNSEGVNLVSVSKQNCDRFSTSSNSNKANHFTFEFMSSSCDEFVRAKGTKGIKKAEKRKLSLHSKVSEKDKRCSLTINLFSKKVEDIHNGEVSNTILKHSHSMEGAMDSSPSKKIKKSRLRKPSVQNEI